MSVPKRGTLSFRPVAQSLGAWLLLALAACAAPTEAPRETSVRPGANERFLDPDLPVQSFVDTFEGESREIARERDRIADVLGLQPGMAVADIGAGTGLFLEPLATAVGPQGRVYAVELSTAFVRHLKQRAAEHGWTQVQTVLCTEDSTTLPVGAVDVALVCDTYHHFEYPRATLASLHEALVPGGRLVIVDFEREPGRSRDWVLEHVRLGRDAVRAEVEAAGFRFEALVPIEGLVENYVLVFVRD